MAGKTPRLKLLMITRALAQFSTTQAKFREIANLGVDLTVVSPARWAGSDRELQRVNSDGFEMVLHNCWFSGAWSDRVGNHLYFYPGIARVIGGERWDVVHVDEEPFNLATYHALRACKVSGVPAVFTTYQNIDKSYPPPFNFFENYIFKNASGAIAFNGEGLDLLRRRGFNAAAAYIPVGIDANIFCKSEVSGLRGEWESRGSFVIGFMGRIHPSKGLDTLVKSLALLPENCTLVLVGRGPYQPALEGLIRQLHLEKRVRWAPWVDSSQVTEYMSAFDVFVLPSRTERAWKEQFGRVAAEAMSCETCVVGSDSGDIPNVIGNAGLIFHEGDEQELAGQLRRLLDDPGLRETLGRRGRQRVLEHFAYEKIARDSVEFYGRVCSGVTEMNVVAV